MLPLERVYNPYRRLTRWRQGDIGGNISRFVYWPPAPHASWIRGCSRCRRVIQRHSAEFLLTDTSQGYKAAKTCQESSHEHHCRSSASLALSVSIAFSWAISVAPLLALSLSPPPLLPFSCSVIVFLPLSYQVSRTWQLVSITAIPQAQGCVRLIVHQKV